MRLPLKLQSNHSESTRGVPTSVTSNTERSTHANTQKTKVSGVRRIWGTLKSTTAFTVSSTLKKLSTLGNKLALRRKYKTNEGSVRTQWWFVVKGSETDLEELEKEWDRVQLQTGWKLENCYMTLSPLLPSNPELIHPSTPEKHDETSADVPSNTPDPNTNTINDNSNVMINESPTQTSCTNNVAQSPFLDTGNQVPIQTT